MNITQKEVFVSELFYHLAISQKAGKTQTVVTLPEAFSNRAKALLKAGSALEKSALDLLWKKPPARVEEGWLFSISPETAFALFKMLSGTARLLYKGQKVILDPFTKAQGFIQARPINQTQIEISAKFTIGKQEESLANCTAIFWGSPKWIIYTGIIRLLDTEANLKWLKIPQGILEGEELQDFLQEVEGVVWLQKERILSDPLPFISLSDQHGGFANLWFDYGIRGKIGSFEEKEAPWRKKAIEKQWEQDLLETDFRKKKVGSSLYYCPLDKVAKSITFLLEIGWKVFDHQNRKVVCLRDETLSLEKHSEAWRVRCSFDYQDYQANLSQVMGAFNCRSQFIELASHTVGLIDLKKIEEKWMDFSDLAFDQEGTYLPFKQLGLLFSRLSIFLCK